MVYDLRMSSAGGVVQDLQAEMALGVNGGLYPDSAKI